MCVNVCSPASFQLEEGCLRQPAPTPLAVLRLWWMLSSWLPLLCSSRRAATAAAAAVGVVVVVVAVGATAVVVAVVVWLQTG